MEILRGGGGRVEYISVEDVSVGPNDIEEVDTD
jgi:hypothetical protein